jgi:hypothetical protein
MAQQAEQIDDEPLSTTEIESPGTPTAAETREITAGRQSVISDLETLRKREQAGTTEQVESLKKKETAQAPLRTEAIEAMRAREAAGGALAAQPVPSLGQPPKLQNFMDRDTANMMAGVASLIAGFNSNGRIRGLRANQSLAAGINGYMKGAYEKAYLGLQDWKNQVEAQLTEFKMMRQQKLDILNASGMTLEDKLAEIKLVGAPYDNQLIQAKQEKEGIDGVLAIDKEMAQIINATEKTLQKADPTMQHLKEQEMQSRIRLNQARAMVAESSGAVGRLSKPDDNKPAGAGNYYDKLSGRFIPNIPTRGELREDPDRYVRTSNEDRKAIEFLYSALDQLPELEARAKEVLPTGGLLSVPLQSLKGVTASVRPGEAATKLQDFKQRASALKLEATRLETGSSRVLGAVLAEVGNQIPSVTTNRDTAVNQLKTLRELINIRLGTFLQSRETEAVSGKIRVKRKSDGITGKIPEGEFDPQLYERVQ